MPELAEVETICRQLAPLAGRNIVASDSRPEPHWVGARRTGRLGVAVRRGKFVALPLDAVLPATPDGGEATEREATTEWLVVHLGMTGALDLVSADAPAPHIGHDHLCAWWRLDDGRTLTLTDSRRFGRVLSGPDLDAVVGPLGPDPLDADFVPRFVTQIAGRRAAVKALLLDRRVVAGVGNYLADESCFRARVHPGARELSERDATRLGVALAAFAGECLAAGGATFRTYRSLTGPGRAQELFACYGRGAFPCLRCRTLLESASLAGRTTVWCPRCQQAPPV